MPRIIPMEFIMSFIMSRSPDVRAIDVRSLHDDGASHSALQVTGDKACVNKSAGLGEAPQQFPAVVHSDLQRMRVVVCHVGMLFHLGGMPADALFGAEDEFVIEQALVVDDESDLLALLHL